VSRLGSALKLRVGQQRRMVVPAIVVGVASVSVQLALAGGALAACASGAVGSTSAFGPAGAEQCLTTPAGVSDVHVLAVGAPGGAGDLTATALGEEVSADVTIPPGVSTLYVEVGGLGVGGANQAGGAGGFNGGANGGSGDGTGTGGAGGYVGLSGQPDFGSFDGTAGGGGTQETAGAKASVTIA
jgi:hypothetical protein